MRRVLANRLVLAVAALSVAVSTAFGAFVVLPVPVQPVLTSQQSTECLPMRSRRRLP